MGAHKLLKMGIKQSKRSVDISSTPKKGGPEVEAKEEKIVAEVIEEKPANGEAVVTENGDAKTEINGDVKKEEEVKEEVIKEIVEEVEKEKGDGDSKETEEGVEKSDEKPEEKKKESKATNLRKKLSFKKSFSFLRKKAA